MANAESVDELVCRYAEAAAIHGKATESGDHQRANAAHAIISNTYNELRSRGLDAQRALLPLLEHSDVGVRVWAASHALEFSQSDGEQVLTEIAAIPASLVSFTAKTTLNEWRAGRLRFP